ncbi:MAG: CpsD/CapB family tyrosine-protein kinase [Bacillota bacterium]
MRWPLRSRYGEAGAEGPTVLVMGDRRSLAAEAFRNLRTNLQYAAVGSKLRSIVVTAAGPDEGKSTITANLAVAVGQGGTRVIAVGADLRRPSLHRAFGLSHHAGLTSVLLGRLPLEEAVHHIERYQVDVLPSGPLPPNPAELLGSSQMGALLEELTRRWDLVLVDTPPVVALSDASLLAAKTDGVLLVVTANQTPREVVAAARRQLEQVGARIVGVVLNRVRPGEVGHYHYYYYYYSRDGAPPAGDTLLPNGAGPHTGDEAAPAPKGGRSR